MIQGSLEIVSTQKITVSFTNLTTAGGKRAHGLAGNKASGLRCAQLRQPLSVLESIFHSSSRQSAASPEPGIKRAERRVSRSCQKRCYGNQAHRSFRVNFGKSSHKEYSLS